MASKNGYDQPEGVIIGGTYVSWQLVYDGRPQSGKEYAESEDEAMEQARARIAQLKHDNCGYPCYLYGDSTLWTVRIGL